jgi:hypothetical protein
MSSFSSSESEEDQPGLRKAYTHQLDKSSSPSLSQRNEHTAEEIIE